MAQSFRIETLDRSGRWYLTPGARSIYDLRIRNDSKNAVDCSLVVEDPATGVSVEPNVFSLRGHEVRTVTVTFAPDVTSVRSHRVLLSLHADDDGRLLATFEHPLVATGGTDCSVAMALKGAIVEAGELRGFEMTCSVRSQSEARSTFQVSLSPHPSFTIPELPALALEPGQVGEVVIPIRWNRTVKDNNGWNHPAIFELAVPVSNGRRTSRMRWELIEGKLEPFMKNGAASANGTVAAPQAEVKVESAAPASSPQSVVAPAAKPEPDVAPRPIATPQPAAAAAATPQPEIKPPISEPAKTATVIQMPAAPVMAPAAAAASATAVQEAPALRPAASKVAATPIAPLMLNGYVERLMLAAPVDAKPAAVPYVNGSSATARVEVAKTVEVAKPSTNVAAPPAAPQGEAIELSLFPVNGKHEDVAQKPAPADPKATSAVQATPAAQPVQSAPAQAAPAKTEPAVTQPATPSVSAQPKPLEQAQKTEAPSAPASAAAAAAVTPTIQPTSAPQWKIVSASESLAASAAQTKSAPAPAVPVAPVAQTQAPAGPTPLPAAAAPATDPNASVQVAPQPAPNGPPPKLTPYAPAKWDAAGEMAAPAAAAKPTSAPTSASAATEKLADLTPAAPTAQASGASRAMRERQMLEAQAQRRPRPGLMIGGLAAVAIIVGIFVFKPSPQPQAPSTTPVIAAPPVVAVNPTHAVKPAVMHARAAIKPALTVKPVAKAAATATPATTPKAATPTPATAAPATPKPAAQRPAVVATRPRPAPSHVARYGKLYQPESGSVVALGGIEAYYGPRGRAVRVIWSAAEQASATVSLIDDHGSTVNSVGVRGGRESVILYLPRGYHGGLTVQVSSIGRLGERVAQTTSLPPFGN